MELCFYYDCLNQRFDSPVATQTKTDVQTLIPYSKKYGFGWCSYHNQWERVFMQNETNLSNLFFSCGFPVQGHLGFNQTWNLNQITLEYDTENKFLIIKQKFTYDEVVDKVHYKPKIVYARCFDFNNGRIAYPANHNLSSIPSFLDSYIDPLLKVWTKELYGIEISRNNSDLNDFFKYPSCPGFSKLVPVIDNGKTFNFREELNLFKEFCRWMKIKESKKVRKSFMKNPRSLLVYGLCQQIGFTDSNAIQLIAENKHFLSKYTKSNSRLRFSMTRREVYMANTYFHYENGFFCNFVDGLRLWVQNALTDKTQIVVAKRMLKFMLEEDYHIITDTAHAYLLNARNLPVPFHERILTEGFTEQIHNQISPMSKSKNSEKYVCFDYSPDEKDLEMIIYKSEVENNKVDNSLTGKIFHKRKKTFIAPQKDSEELKNLVDDENDEIEINDFDQTLDLPEFDSTFDIARRFSKDDISKNDYYFLLPKNTNELYEISKNMRNCVGYLYRNKVI